MGIGSTNCNIGLRKPIEWYLIGDIVRSNVMCAYQFKNRNTVTEARANLTGDTRHNLYESGTAVWDRSGYLIPGGNVANGLSCSTIPDWASCIIRYSDGTNMAGITCGTNDRILSLGYSYESEPGSSYWEYPYLFARLSTNPNRYQNCGGFNNSGVVSAVVPTYDIYYDGALRTKSNSIVDTLLGIDSGNKLFGHFTGIFYDSHVQAYKGQIKLIAAAFYNIALTAAQIASLSAKINGI